MSSLKIKILERLDRFASSRAKLYMNMSTYVRNHLFFEKFQEREDDIYIVTFMKSGTTWMQMICYQLLTDGNMDFNHIYDVSPWLSNAAITDVAPESINRLASPRFFKCHDVYDKFDPQSKGKFIFVYRDGKDVAVSILHHIRNYNDPDFTLDNVFEEYFSLDKEYNWFKFTEEWLKNEHNFNVLFVKYEDLKSDFETSIRRIAGFLNVELSEELLARVTERSSFEFMKKYETKFGEQPEDKRVYNQFIRKGEVGEGRALTEQQNAYYEDMYSKIIDKHKNRLDSI